MRAIVLTSFTGLDGLEFAQVPDPVPGEGEQLVRVRAASLGPWDRYSPEGAFVAMGGSSEFPQVQGWDFVGQTSDGRRVLGFVPQLWMGVGAFAEQIAVPSAILAPLPEAVGFPEGSTLPVCGLTARLLVEGLGLAAGAGAPAAVLHAVAADRPAADPRAARRRRPDGACLAAGRRVDEPGRLHQRRHPGR